MGKKLVSGVLIVGATMLALLGGDNSLAQTAVTVLVIIAAACGGFLLSSAVSNSDEPTDSPYN